jgi:hypothetical protein
MPATGSRPPFRDGEQPSDHDARADRRRAERDRQSEDVDHVGEDARVIGLLELDVDLQRGALLRGHPAVELREADREALGLVRLRRGQHPEHPLVETRPRTRPDDVPQVDLPVDAMSRAHRMCRQRGEEVISPREAVTREVRLAVARGEERLVARERPLVRHHRPSRLPTTIAAVPATRSAARPQKTGDINGVRSRVMGFLLF